MRENPIIPRERQIAMFNAKFPNDRALFLREQYALGNIFINDFDGVELCYHRYMTGIGNEDKKSKIRHKNKIIRVLKKEGYSLMRSIPAFGYHNVEEMENNKDYMINKAMNKDYMINKAMKAIGGNENTRFVFTEKTMTNEKKLKLFEEVLFKEI